MKAIWNDKIIAESDKTMKIENDTYFPIESINMEYLQKNGNKTECEPQGDACYYDLVAGERKLTDAASSFDQPGEGSEHMRDFIVFSKDLRIED
ncbi:MAG TPA: DUF427 domain-containing protein [Cytophagaceae bacterium]